MNIDVSKYITRGKFTYQSYLRKKAAEARVDLSSVGWGEKSLIYANQWQGEHFNNGVTAVGTAFIAPIFIINNPLAKEDLDTKKYTAARQPISAFITLAGQVPVMMAYNKMLDNYVTEHRLDRCDLHAAPPKSYYNSLYTSQRRKFFLENPNFIGNVSKSQIEKLYYDKVKNTAFATELSCLRNIIHNTPFETEQNYKKVKEQLRAVMDENNFIKIEALISPKDYEVAEKQLVQDYLTDKHKIFFNEKGKIIQIGENVIEDKYLQKEIKTASDLKKSGIKSLLKRYGVDIPKDEIAALKSAITDDVIQQKAIKTVDYEVRSKARAKYKLAQMAREAKATLTQSRDLMLAQRVPELQIKTSLQIQNNLLLNEMLEQAKIMLEKANANPGCKTLELNADEAKYLYDKLSQKISNEHSVNSNAPKTFFERAKLMIYNCFEKDKDIMCMRTDGRNTFEDALRDQQVKKWLTAKINNSEKVLKNFKTISGLIVGLAILPITCGALNWAYPRIMSEFFPHLANPKAKQTNTKEVA